MLRMRLYLYGSTSTLRTDQEALGRSLNVADVYSPLARWRLCLAEYEHDIQHRPDINRQLADGTSRLRTDGRDDKLLDDEVPCFAVKNSDNGLLDGKSVLVWWEEGYFRSKNWAMVPEVFAAEDAYVMPVKAE